MKSITCIVFKHLSKDGLVRSFQKKLKNDIPLFISSSGVYENPDFGLIPSPQNGCSPGSYKLNIPFTPFLHMVKIQCLLFKLSNDIVFVDKSIGQAL